MASKINEIQTNLETIKMMKDVNMSNDEIKETLKSYLTLMDENLINSLIELDLPFFQSILLRLKLQEKLKLDNSSLKNTFNEKVHHLIDYLILDNQKININETIKKETSKPKKITKKKIEVDEDKINLINNYLDTCISTSENDFLEFEDLFDDFNGDWIKEQDFNKGITKDELKFVCINKFGNLKKNKEKIEGWKNLEINEE